MSPQPPDLDSPYLDANLVYIPAGKQTSNGQGGGCRYQLLFITGNPGCIGYYHSFLGRVAKALGQGSGAAAGVSIYGVSLRGFVDGDHGAAAAAAAAATGEGRVASLDEQIEFVEGCLRDYIAAHAARDSRTQSAAVPTAAAAAAPAPEHKVIVVGHSLGGYMGLELMRRWRQRHRAGTHEPLAYLGYIGLWPAVTWLSKSPRGRRAGWLIRLPYVAELVSVLASVLVALLGHTLLMAVLAHLLNFPDDSAAVTAAFLESRRGVQQALHLARDEISQITADRWDEDIWGAATPVQGYPRPKLVFYFGQDDHWVSNHCRDQLIKARGWYEGGEEWRPKMLIDDLGIPHSFCIRHSAVAADKTAAWVKEMIDGTG